MLHRTEKPLPFTGTNQLNRDSTADLAIRHGVHDQQRPATMVAFVPNDVSNYASSLSSQC